MKRKLQSGFTIIELLIGLLAASIVTYAAMSLYITQHKELIVQDQISDMQANIRSAATVIAEAVRMAGYNVHGGMSAIETYNTNPDSIVITYDNGKLDGVKLSHDMTQVSSDLTCQDYDISNVQEGDELYIYDPVADAGEFFVVNRVLEAPARLRHDTPLNRTYPEDSEVISLSRVKFYVDQSDVDHPDLMMQNYGSNPSVFAENITDLNFRYFLTSGGVVTQTNTPSLIRMVEINLVGRTDQPDEDFAENYRTRDFTLRVKVRNLDF